MLRTSANPIYVDSTQQHPYLQAAAHMKSMSQHFNPEHSSSMHRLHGTKEPMNIYHKYPYVAYDHYPHDAGVAKSKAMKSLSEEPVAMNDHPSSGCALDNPHHDFMPSEVNVRSLNEADDEFTDHANHMDYNNDRFFDDVFLQISPDYGCLV